MSARASLRPAILGVWLLAAAVLTLANAGNIARLSFHDPDDAMRLLEVRDWLAGQSFWDVSQHRLGGGTVFQMHWSRLVDLPLAALVALLTPVLGADIADRVAMVLVPLGQLLLVLVLLSGITNRLAGDAAARTALLLVPITAPLVAQLQPMRIDHHGWQLVLGLAAARALLGAPTARNGLWAGLSIAGLVTVSLEGLPFAAGIAGVAALAWAFDPARRPQLLALAWSLFAGALALHLVTRGPGMFAPACDAVSPLWLAILGTAALGLTAAVLTPASTVSIRIALLALAGAAALAVLFALGRDCLGGPFGRLDPLTRSVWFDHVAEGLPLWKQRAAAVLISFSLPLVGLFAGVRALRRAAPERRMDWAMLLGLQVIALFAAVMVLRAGATANALAIPGAASLVATLLERARAIPRLLPRLAATIGALAVAAPGLVFAAVTLPPSRSQVSGSSTPARAVCVSGEEVAALARLPAGRIFAPLDVGPEILVRTRHQAIASGYHRNTVAMHDVIAAFLGTPGAAQATVARYGARYIAVCPGLDEPDLYRKLAPNGFWARLERGERFAWLEPVPMPGSPVRAWKVIG